MTTRIAKIVFWHMVYLAAVVIVYRYALVNP